MVSNGSSPGCLRREHERNRSDKRCGCEHGYIQRRKHDRSNRQHDGRDRS
jgi:hypothetical protein